jgi:hypothetical protein
MTKFKTYKFGTMTFKQYFKPVGHGFEVGFIYGGKPVFVGNFIHAKEANQWWTKMSSELKFFFNKHEFVPTASTVWYNKYISNYLYKSYYAWLDKCFDKYNRSFTKATGADFKRYQAFEKNYYRRQA